MAHPLKGLEFMRNHVLPRGEIRQLNARVFEINHDTLKTAPAHALPRPPLPSPRHFRTPRGWP
jgi:hypothetical protein